MGSSDVLLSAKVGYCPTCMITYVTSSYILCDDSHTRLQETYACPQCGQDIPKWEKPADKRLSGFARKHLEKRLRWEKPNGLVLIASEEE
ncbi:MAG: hypothetical protein V1743_06765 [Nanoarchaeota archaeon]